MHLFVVDDDPLYKMIARRLFNDFAGDVEIKLFDNGEDALNGFKNLEENQLPSIIMLDIEMPVMDGWEFLEEFCKIPAEKRKNTRICIVTSSISNGDIEKAGTFPEIVDYIPKPLTGEKLLRILGR